MKITSKQDGVLLIVRLAGRMDAVSAPELEEFMSGHDLSGRFVLDLSELEYVSSAGLRTLLMMGKQVKAASGALVLAGLNGIVREVFELSGFQKLFLVRDTIDDAIAGLA
jgi:anti-sigma B factor antagonist/stage II sporulation protein AA (anti-sigma F factor antagonist)